MERLDIELDYEVDGVSKIGLFQPSYRHRNFVLKIRESLIKWQLSDEFKSLQERHKGGSGAIENAVVNESESEPKNKVEFGQIYGGLILANVDLSKLMSEFADMLQDGKVAQANGVALPGNFANKLSMSQFEKIFARYLDFFIVM